MHRLPVQGTEWHTDNRGEFHAQFYSAWGDLDAVESTATYMYYWYRMVPVKVLLFYGIPVSIW